jgi:phospholipid/cholesterol/gamma-HCH transport system substrate-binding protein
MLRVVNEADLKRRNFKLGLIVLLVAAVGIYFGFTKSNPLASPFELKAAFDDVVTLKPGAPVRVAGVVVGKVTSIEQPPTGDRGATVTMELKDSGLPVHEDAQLHLKPRIFLEGNMFVDLRPGSPSARELRDGAVLPPTQTSAPVGFGQVLGALQKSTREDLQTVLDEYGQALAGGARAINRSTKHWEGAYRDSSIVSDALRGQRARDLSGYVDTAGTVAAALDRDPVALKDLVTNFAITADSFASEQQRLRQAIAVLPQTLRRGYAAFGALNDAFPAARRLIAALRPAVRSSGPALDAQIPLLRELRGLLSSAELGGFSRELRRVVPDLVEMARGGVGLQTQARRLASCQVNSVIPTAESQIDDPAFPTTGKVFQEGVKWLPGIAGESRGFDANGQYVKTTVRGGLNLVYQFGDDRFFMTSRPLLGVNPPKAKEPPYREDVPCETQDAPDVQSKPAAAPEGRRIGRSGERYEKRYTRAQSRALTWLRRQLKVEGLNKTLRVVSDAVDKSDLRVIRAQALRARR